MGYFNHPFEVSNKVKLMDDLYLDMSLSEDSLASDFDGVVDISTKKGKRTATDREVVDEDIPNAIFDFSAAINKAG